MPPAGATAASHRLRAWRDRADEFREHLGEHRPSRSGAELPSCRHLLQDAVEPLSSSPARLHLRELPRHNESSLESLSKSLDLQIRGKPVIRDDVDERAERRRHTHAVGHLDVVVSEPAAMEAQHSRDGRHPLESRRNRHVELRRHDIGERVEGERCVMTERALRLSTTIVSPELPQHQIRPGGQGESRKPVDTSVLADPVAVAHMTRVRVISVAGQPGLARGEETALSLGDLVELFFRVWPFHGI